MSNIIDFKDGNVTYNEFYIDFSIPYDKQVDCLLEDLIQVEYNNGYILDVGWYPEFDYSGQFIIQIIEKYEWESPTFYRKCNDEENLKKNLIDAVQIINAKFL